MEKYKLIKLFDIKGVPVNVHWSLSVILVLVFLGGLSDISLLVGAVSFWSVMLIHEIGHMWFATRLGLSTVKIDLYPVHGVCYNHSADNDYENYLVAWGGVVVQAIVFTPCIIIYHLFGDYLPWFVNTPLIFLGYVSAGIAIINLVPSRGLDGGKCWRAIPLYFQSRKVRTKKIYKKNSHLKVVKGSD